MLDLAKVNLASLGEALEDHSPEIEWYFDPRTGEADPVMPDADLYGDELSVDLDALIRVQPLSSRDAYNDRADFAALVPDRRASDLLMRAIGGRGAFRRFKDTLFEFPGLRETWLAFHDARARRRAIAWLVEEGLIDDDVARRALADHPDPYVGGGPLDIDALARDAKARLADLYGDRLRDVLIFGSHARGDATDESDLDLLIVLADLAEPWEELRRIDPVLWALTQEGGITVSGFPVSADELEHPASPVLIRAKAEAQPVP